MSIIAPMLRKQTTFAFKAETTTGTEISLSASDGTTIVYDGDVEQDVEFNKRQGQGSLSQHVGIVGAQMANVKLTTDFPGSGTAANAPSYESLLLAAGLSVSASTTRIYSPATGSGSMTTLTCARYLDGKKYAARGVAMNFTMKGESGKHVSVEWEGKGAWIDPIATAMITPTYVVTPVPPRLVSATFTIGGTSYLSRSFEFTPNNVISVRRDMGSLVGVHSAVITDRDPTFTCDVEASTSKIWHSDLTAGTTAAISLAIGTSAGNTWTLAIPVAQLAANPEKIDIDGVAGYKLTFQCARNSAVGDDEFTLTHS